MEWSGAGRGIRSSRWNLRGRRLAGRDRGRVRVHRAAALLGAITIIFAAQTHEAAAQTTFFDHLNCYKVSFKDGEIQVADHVLDALTLTSFQNPPFDVEQGCQLQPAKKPRPTHLCVAVDKQPRQNPIGNRLGNYFLVYRLRCQEQADIRVGVFDQFVRGIAGVRRKSTSRSLLVPAYQLESQDSPCGPTGADQCGGGCPDFNQSCQHRLDGTCGCVDYVPCGGDPVGGQCGGSCAPGDICTTDYSGKCACLR
jgi:hypothetical protein